MTVAGNTQPQFTKQANAGTPQALTTANTSSEGGGTIGTNIYLVLTAGTNDTYVEFIRFFPTASAAGTTTTATVARIFLSSVGTGTTTSSNTWCIGEVNLPSVTADSATAANNPVDFPIGERIPAGYFLLVTTHAAPAASTQWVATPFANDY